VPFPEAHNGKWRRAQLSSKVRLAARRTTYSNRFHRFLSFSFFDCVYVRVCLCVYVYLGSQEFMAKPYDINVQLLDAMTSWWRLQTAEFHCQSLQLCRQSPEKTAFVQAKTNLTPDYKTTKQWAYTYDSNMISYSHITALCMNQLWLFFKQTLSNTTNGNIYLTVKMIATFTNTITI